MTAEPVAHPGGAEESRQATLTSNWLMNHIREHGGAMIVVRDVVVD